MIIILGSVNVRDGKLSKALEISQAHVDRSRLEPGCIEHGVHLDSENKNKLVFVERWESMDLLRAHFAVPESSAFAKAMAALSIEPPSIALYSAEILAFPGKSAA
ncbi:MAG: antibiotic biosynthesis monooxygenase [Betaproteobacteria bacterium HGW-Betaproteobacteria-15]|nr:MAG: antibiotic biosynthesis monooxygenase [Betaproteobacteria bacterium HGW-Betaproteobacteria-15]